MYQSTLDGRFLSVDPLFAEMLGYGSAREMMEKIHDIGAQLYVDRDARAQLLERIMTWGAVSNLENQVYRKDGKVLWVSEYCRAVRRHDGTLDHFQGAFADISGYKAAATEAARLGGPDEMPGLRRAAAGQGRRIPVKDGTRVRFVETAKIVFIKADGDYIHVHSEDGTHVMARDRIGSLERRLDCVDFVRISKSAMLNLNYVREMRSRGRGNYEFVMDCGTHLASGPTYSDAVRKILTELK